MFTTIWICLFSIHPYYHATYYVVTFMYAFFYYVDESAAARVPEEEAQPVTGGPEWLQQARLGIQPSCRGERRLHGNASRARDRVQSTRNGASSSRDISPSSRGEASSARDSRDNWERWRGWTARYKSMRCCNL